MRLRFGPHGQDEEDGTRPRRAPPDYSSRSIKLRLFVLVAMAIVVISLMVEARKPKYYEWMWKHDQRAHGQGTGQITGGDDKPPAADPKFEPRSRPPVAMSSDQIPGTRRTTGHLAPAAPAEETDPVVADLLARTRKDGWSKLFDLLPPEDRGKQHDRLFALLRASRAGTTLTDDEQAEYAKLLRALDKAWSAYRADALASVANLPDQEQASWLAVLGALDSQWSGTELPALQTLAEGNTPGNVERAALTDLQKLLDELALEAIRDDTIPNRSVERHAWFRLFEALGGADEATLRQLSLGPVGYVQLLKQPKDYRGKLVTVKGTVQLAYRVSAPENVEGIKQYYIFWMRPEGDDDAPLVIYALEVPPGFPPVKTKSDDQEANRLEAKAEFTGYLFKRVAYLSKKGTLTTPLLLARSPAPGHWSSAAAGPAGEIPSAGMFAMVIAGAAAFAIAVALFGYYSARGLRHSPRTQVDLSPDDLQKLASLGKARESHD